MTVFEGCALGVGAAVTLLWVVSVALRDASLVDVFWGFGFVLVAGLGLWAGAPAQPRALLLAALTAIWGLRLTAYLARRNLGHGEDKRYVAIRARVGKTFPIASLVLVFWLQGGAILLISAGTQYALRDGDSRPLGLVDAGLTLLWAVGLAFEAVGDAQLARFLKDPANAGRVMDRGLWRYTRHPNYFGDSVVCWSLWLLAFAMGAPAWTVVGPVVMTTLLLRVSGVSLLERTIHERRPDYAQYQARTSAFVPWWPRGSLPREDRIPRAE